MPEKLPLFLGFANSRLPLKNYPFLRESGYERGIRFYRECGGWDLCWTGLAIYNWNLATGRHMPNACQMRALCLQPIMDQLCEPMPSEWVILLVSNCFFPRILSVSVMFPSGTMQSSSACQARSTATPTGRIAAKTAWRSGSSRAFQKDRMDIWNELKGPMWSYDFYSSDYDGWFAKLSCYHCLS